MTTPAAELRLNRINTAAFIACKPVSIALKPQVRERTSTGGFQIKLSPARAAQTFRIIDLSSSYMVDQPPQRTIDGVERTVEFMLLGNYDAQMDTYDIWVDDNGSKWELTQLFPDNGYERRALVVRHGD